MPGAPRRPWTSSFRRTWERQLFRASRDAARRHSRLDGRPAQAAPPAWTETFARGAWSFVHVGLHRQRHVPGPPLSARVRVAGRTCWTCHGVAYQTAENLQGENPCSSHEISLEPSSATTVPRAAIGIEPARRCSTLTLWPRCRAAKLNELIARETGVDDIPGQWARAGRASIRFDRGHRRRHERHRGGGTAFPPGTWTTDAHACTKLTKQGRNPMSDLADRKTDDQASRMNLDAEAALCSAADRQQ